MSSPRTRCCIASPLIVASVLAAPALAQHEPPILYTLPQAAGIYDHGIGAAGDVDADGYADIAIGIKGRVVVHSGKDARVLLDIRETKIGNSIATLGDVDADGHADFVVGARDAEYGGSYTGAAHAYSGKSGKELWRVIGMPLQEVGNAVAGIGDVDGDGVGDALIGAWGYSTVSRGEAFVHSGKSGIRLHSLRGAAGGEQFGWAVAAAGDVDGDGRGDFLVGSPLVSKATLFSGRDAKILWVHADAAIPWLGMSVGSLGDVNADGVPDALVIGNRTRVCSGKDGGLIAELPAGYGGGGVGLGDVDGDGAGDFLTYAASPNYFALHSGKERRLLWTWPRTTNMGFTAVLAALGDVNHDGVPDFACNFPRGTDMVARVFSWRAVSFSSDEQILSVSAGGQATFALNGGDAAAGRFYLVLGSASGTSPGLIYGPHVIPLNPDAWFLTTLASPNVPPFGRSFGFLDLVGRGSATFTLPSGMPPSLIGVRLDHAFMALRRTLDGLDFVSRAVPLYLVK